MSKIIIVESPSKSKTIGTYLGKGYTVLSSKGHVCDLATTGKGGLGIDCENGFIPDYVINPDKVDLVEYLKQRCKGNEVYLATDPDREGEAIAYHLARILELPFDALNRIEFHEITKKAVNQALENPHMIDLKMVDSQESRRMIDRILGFKLSKLLQNKINSKSAGRVQSVALLLIVNREREIIAFVPEKYYEITAEYMDTVIKLNELDGVKVDSEHRITDRRILDDLVAKLREFTVEDVTVKDVKRQSYPTYTTSTLQQDAVNKLSFSPTRTMSVAQSLYEGKNIGTETVGLITYMRTDSTRLADSFVYETFDYINNEFGSEFKGFVKNKEQKNMQDAHEGIRPTSILRTPDSLRNYLTADEYKLYSLIYKRTLASLMAPAVYESTSISLSNTDSKWSMQGSKLKFEGYLKVYGRDAEDKEEALPHLEVGKEFEYDSINIIEKETEPKKRYTEASIIKEMEDLGIGRPSTYAQTIAVLKEREYVTLDGKSLVPSSQGTLTTDKLQEYFSSLINVEYTANMETDLDEIASGEKSKQDELQSFYDAFIPLFEEARINMEKKYPILTDRICPQCGHYLVIQGGRFGEFVACSNYPVCNYHETQTDPTAKTGIICPSCGGDIVKRVMKGKKTTFYGCSNYPKCNVTYTDKPNGEVCPDCGALMLVDRKNKKYCSDHCEMKLHEQFLCPSCHVGTIVLKSSVKGPFYACSNYPDCKTILPGKPTREVCPNCGELMCEKNGKLVCSKTCDAKKQDANTDSSKEVVTDGIKCPSCKKGLLVQRVAKSGKNAGSIFYACNRFPRCRSIVSLEDYEKLKN